MSKTIFIVAGVVTILAGGYLIWKLNSFSKLSHLSEKIQIVDGKHKKFYPNGALQGEWAYSNDKLHGEGFEYYPDGKRKYEDLWVNGNLVWRQTYDTNGVVVDTFGRKPEGLAK